ncbi:hypothetical protein JVX91_17075 [Pseudomonas sp. PDNC002]|uniref:antibiotic biosynthesis monooxygenase n=1 Tax=Pseudomonas sp. PDNC002 TaxID=2811422 RepID=UPI001966A3B9|nr:antibiotic biosynthesis monooxygenase [Pseudomonas sp. PDNC002]QRY77322.1 hypothetical protein JVX91_17075 [Pseudomonas sp. PDNC002]
MSLVAVSTVEIDPAMSSVAGLRTGLEELRADLSRLSGCTAYRLSCGSEPGDTWLLTGYWDSTERMTAHFNLPCLARLFELAAMGLIVGLRFGTFLVASTGD